MLKAVGPTIGKILLVLFGCSVFGLMIVLTFGSLGRIFPNDLLKQAQEKIWAQWPAVWAWTPNNVLAKRKRVQNLNLRATNSYDLAAVTVSGITITARTPSRLAANATAWP